MELLISCAPGREVPFLLAIQHLLGSGAGFCVFRMQAAGKPLPLGVALSPSRRQYPALTDAGPGPGRVAEGLPMGAKRGPDRPVSTAGLVLTRRPGEGIAIGEDIMVVVDAVSRGRARLRIIAPRTVPIRRRELSDGAVHSDTPELS